VMCGRYHQQKNLAGWLGLAVLAPILAILAFAFHSQPTPPWPPKTSGETATSRNDRLSAEMCVDRCLTFCGTNQRRE
jgi:hypothetical protein